MNANGSCAGGNKYQGVAAFLIGGANGLLHIINSTFQTFHRAVTVTDVVLVANNTVFSNNSASATKLVDRPHASALSIYGSDSCSLSNVTFTNNGIGDAAYVMPNASTLLVYQSSITISNCTFLHNMGNALYSYLSDIVFIGFTSFSLNQGYQGAAMNLYVDKNSNVQYLNAQVLFESNTAEYTGGAIQINDMDAENPCCPFNHILSPESPDSGLIIFKNNAARFGGDDIYGGQLDQAFVYHENNVTRCIQILQQTITFLLSRTLSSISSKPSRVCLCNSNYNPDCLQVFDSRDAYPGEDITVSVFAVGQSFGTSAGYVNAQLLLSDTFHSIQL